MDDEFKKTIHKIKPLAKALPRNSDECHKVTLWIKKLLSENNDKLSRNHYANLLLQSLKLGKLETPFDTNPPVHLFPQVKDELNNLFSSSSETLIEPHFRSNKPSTTTTVDNTLYFSTPRRFIPFKNPLSTSVNLVHTSGAVPTPKGLIHSTPTSSTHDKLEKPKPLSTSPIQVSLINEVNHRSPLFKQQPDPTSPVNRKSIHHSLDFSSLSSSTESLLSDDELLRKKKGYSNLTDSDELSDVTTLLESGSKITHQKSKSVKPKSLSFSNKTKSRSLNSIGNQSYNITRDHRKIFDEKNAEIEELRAQHLFETHQLEAKCRNLEAKVIKLEKWNSLTHKEQLRELSETKHTSHQQQYAMKIEYEKKLHTIISDFERQKLDNEQKHSQEIQIVLKEANQRMMKLETECWTEKQHLSKALSEAEDNSQQIMKSLELSDRAKDRITKEKMKLEENITSIQRELNQSRERVLTLEQTCSKLQTEKELRVKEVQSQMEHAIQSLKREASDKQTQACKRIEELKKKITSLQHTLEETTSTHRMKLMEAENSSRKMMKQKEIGYQQKINELEHAQRHKEVNFTKQIQQLENTICEEDMLVKELRAACEIQVKTSEKAVGDYKSKVELQMNSMFADMKNEIEKLEKELADLKVSKKKQEDKFYQQLSQHTATVLSMKEQHQLEVQKMTEEYLHSKEQMITEMRTQRRDQKLQSKMDTERNQQVISGLENEIRNLNNNLQEMKIKHRADLKELKQTSEYDKDAREKLHKTTIAKLKLDIKEQHQTELSNLIEKHNLHSLQMQHDAELKTSIADETIATLQSQLREIREDYERNIELHRQEVEELVKLKEVEIENLRIQHEATVKELSKSIENSKNTSLELENRIQRLQKHYESELSQLKILHESRLKELLPLSAKQQYQDTIQSLKLQVQLLHQRAGVLQKQLDQSNACINLRKHMKSNPVLQQRLHEGQR